MEDCVWISFDLFQCACNREGERNRGKGENGLWKFHCVEQQEPSTEGQMHVGRKVLSKDMKEVQKLIARTSKQEKKTACLLIQRKDNLTCTCII